VLVHHQVTKRLLRLLICFGLAVRVMSGAGMCSGNPDSGGAVISTIRQSVGVVIHIVFGPICTDRVATTEWTPYVFARLFTRGTVSCFLMGGI
jgi:hypothetical protein